MFFCVGNLAGIHGSCFDCFGELGSPPFYWRYSSPGCWHDVGSWLAKKCSAGMSGLRCRLRQGWRRHTAVSEPWLIPPKTPKAPQMLAVLATPAKPRSCQLYRRNSQPYLCGHRAGKWGSTSHQSASFDSGSCNFC